MFGPEAVVHRRRAHSELVAAIAGSRLMGGSFHVLKGGAPATAEA